MKDHFRFCLLLSRRGVCMLMVVALWISLPAGAQSRIKPGAENTTGYLPLLSGKRVGLFANHTSTVGDQHLVDVLRANNVDVTVIFGPEHGFRGTAGAGEKVGNYVDEETGIPVVSLYGSKRAPTADDLKNVDVMLFDIQDVGVRFYTYISSLQHYLEAAILNDKQLIVLDRPNPNGFYIAGPVLNRKYSSFVGMQPVPVVYGMTMGEYALMLAGEKWLSAAANEKYQPQHLTIIKNQNYDHTSKYELPVKPSPNLPTIQSIYVYPSTCFFEGTTLSEGRGTEFPFQVFGAPTLPDTLYSFTPRPTPGAKSSKHYGEVCYGWKVVGTPTEILENINGQLQIGWLLRAYKLFPNKDKFFIRPTSGNMDDSFFTKLAGTNELWKQIVNGVPEHEIVASWQPEIEKFKKIRKKYLLYKDFEP